MLTDQILDDMENLDTSKLYIDDPDWTTERGLELIREIRQLRGLRERVVREFDLLHQRIRELERVIR